MWCGAFRSSLPSQISKSVTPVVRLLFQPVNNALVPLVLPLPLHQARIAKVMTWRGFVVAFLKVVAVTSVHVILQPSFLA
jgi:hypothetical protein